MAHIHGYDIVCARALTARTHVHTCAHAHTLTRTHTYTHTRGGAKETEDHPAEDIPRGVIAGL